MTDKTAEQLRASSDAPNLHEAMRIVAQTCCNSDIAWGAWLILLQNLEVRNVTVSDKDIDVAIDAATKADNFQGFSGYRRSAMRAALNSFASSILKHEVSDDEIDQAVEAFDNVYDGVSHNKRDAIREVLQTVNTRADSGEAVAYQVRIPTGNWQECTWDEFERVSHNRPNDARQLFTHPSATDEDVRKAFAFDALVAAGFITQAKADESLNVADAAIARSREAA